LNAAVVHDTIMINRNLFLIIASWSCDEDRIEDGKIG
jgi:hypothetical protein